MPWYMLIAAAGAAITLIVCLIKKQVVAGIIGAAICFAGPMLGATIGGIISGQHWYWSKSLFQGIGVFVGLFLGMKIAKLIRKS